MRSFLAVFCAAVVLVGLGSTVQAQPKPAFRIVFEGNTRGVSSGATRMDLGAVLFDWAAENDGRVRIDSSGFGALYESGR